MIDGLIRDFDIRTFGIADLNTQFLAEFDAVCFPGGMGDADDFDKIFTEDHISAVQEYVICGGKYFGICMGAYWAGPNYFDVAPNLEIGQYIERPTSDITTDGPTVADVVWLDEDHTMYFYDGCAILGDDMDVYATYANGDPMAVIQGNVGMIGCHPEALDWWYADGDMLNYYEPRHAELMSNFLKDLINE
jgi:glutamine amidotransferase-like uncharacterized protein